MGGKRLKCPKSCGGHPSHWRLTQPPVDNAFPSIPSVRQAARKKLEQMLVWACNNLEMTPHFSCRPWGWTEMILRAIGLCASVINTWREARVEGKLQGQDKIQRSSILMRIFHRKRYPFSFQSRALLHSNCIPKPCPPENPPLSRIISSNSFTVVSLFVLLDLWYTTTQKGSIPRKLLH